MNETTKPEKPTKEYYYALCSKAAAIILEYKDLKFGNKLISPEEKEDWNRRKDELHQEIQRVRKFL
jgi:hypothetical protein